MEIRVRGARSRSRSVKNSGRCWRAIKGPRGAWHSYEARRRPVSSVLLDTSLVKSRNRRRGEGLWTAQSFCFSFLPFFCSLFCFACPLAARFAEWRSRLDLTCESLRLARHRIPPPPPPTKPAFYPRHVAAKTPVNEGSRAEEREWTAGPATLLGLFWDFDANANAGQTIFLRRFVYSFIGYSVLLASS